jgi:hypothetical protein
MGTDVIKTALTFVKAESKASFVSQTNADWKKIEEAVRAKIGRVLINPGKVCCSVNAH